MELTFGRQEPENDEVAAIVAAVMNSVMSNSRSTVSPLSQDDSTWRFSGRWWNSPVTARNRPSYLRP